MRGLMNVEPPPLRTAPANADGFAGWSGGAVGLVGPAGLVWDSVGFGPPCVTSHTTRPPTASDPTRAAAARRVPRLRPGGAAGRPGGPAVGLAAACGSACGEGGRTSGPADGTGAGRKVAEPELTTVGCSHADGATPWP